MKTFVLIVGFLGIAVSCACHSNTSRIRSSKDVSGKQKLAANNSITAMNLNDTGCYELLKYGAPGVCDKVLRGILSEFDKHIAVGDLVSVAAFISPSQGLDLELAYEPGEHSFLSVKHNQVSQSSFLQTLRQFEANPIPCVRNPECTFQCKIPNAANDSERYIVCDFYENDYGLFRFDIEHNHWYVTAISHNVLN